MWSSDWRRHSLAQPDAHRIRRAIEIGSRAAQTRRCLGPAGRAQWTLSVRGIRHGVALPSSLELAIILFRRHEYGSNLEQGHRSNPACCKRALPPDLAGFQRRSRLRSMRSAGCRVLCGSKHRGVHSRQLSASKSAHQRTSRLVSPLRRGVDTNRSFARF